MLDDELPAVDLARLHRAVVFGNGKGGVGKTSLTANTGGLLAADGARVLLVDLNVQGNLAEDLGYVGTDIDDQGAALVRSILEGTPLTPVPAVRPNLDIVPGGERLVDVPPLLFARYRTNVTEAALALARCLVPIAEDYDVILIDSPPEDVALQQLALTAARWMVIPVRSDDSSRKGMRMIAKQFRTVRRVNPDLQLLGVVLFATNASAKRLHAEVRADIEKDLGGAAHMFSQTVRYVEAAARDCRRRGQLAHELELAAANSPKSYEVAAGKADRSQLIAGSASSLAEDYAVLTREIFERMAQMERAEVPA